MPEKIDRIGRAHEWGTLYYLLNHKKGEKEFNQYMSVLPQKEKKRVYVACEKTSKKIRELNDSQIVDADVIGEESKKPGTEDFDIIVKFADGTKKGYSLKLQKNCTGVNVRNPTLNSLCKYFTGKNFNDFITPNERIEYQKKGELYSKGYIESKEVGTWGANKLSTILNNELSSNPGEFVKTTLEQIRVSTNLILTVVDKNAEFIGHVTKFVEVFDRIKQDPLKIRVYSNGISVFFEFDGIKLFKIDVFMMSDSSGLGKKLRAVIRVNFEIDS